MIEVIGTHNRAVCFTHQLEEAAEKQILAVCCQEVFAGSKIRIMPDVHAGMGCTIGTTMTIRDKVVPGMVGVDIGCGMETVRLAEKEIDFAALDALIRRTIPCGREVRKTPHELNDAIDLTALFCRKEVNLHRAWHSIGTLGGGNHFIEIDRGDDGSLYLVVHSGSRHLGSEAAMYYQTEGYKMLCGNAKRQLDEMIAEMRAAGREKEIQKAVKERKKQKILPDNLPKDLAYVEGALFEEYIHDMKLIQQFAALNRRAMTEVILSGMHLTEVDRFTTTHNYIDTDEMILRKGAVSAKAGEKLLIPLNMRDGALICTGKGNAEWNCSAPHGAGRKMSRRAAFDTLSMAQYRAEMKAVFSTCVDKDTLDEAPMAYKSSAEIEEEITPTAEILCRIRPLYNFKAAE
ncbi:MAG: RtcB family protein [Clostridia bacterium]|nr:RtcB family protein [Clostridia bacterium]